MHPTVTEFEKSQQKKGIPEFRPGDTVRVSVRIVEGDKERIQDYEGVVIRRKGGGLRETFTVRRVSFGVGMERIFPLHSPRIEGIKLVRRGKVRRAKLYYLRELRGKKARIQEKRGLYQSAANDAADAAKAAATAEAAAAEKATAESETTPAPESEPTS